MIELKSIKPAINSQFFPLGNSGYLSTPRNYPIKELMRFIKITPECIGIGKRIVTDIFTSYSFEAIDKKQTGRPSTTYKKDVEDKANIFASQVNLKQKLFTAGLDWVFTGDGYIWTGKIGDEKLKEIANKYYKTYGIELKEFKAEIFDEDYNILSQLDIIPSTTVEIRHDVEKVLYYRQLVGVSHRDFFPDTVVHAKFMSVDGDVYGFTPMRAAGGVIQNLVGIKTFSANYFKQSGLPDVLFMMPKEMVGSPNAKALEETLEKYKKNQNRGNMLISGEVTIEKINEWNKDMEFRQLAIYLTGVLAFSFNMPADILSAILGTDIKGTSMGSDIEDAGYNRNIENAQEYWENILNSQIFNKYFGVNIRFDRTFRQDQIRIAQYRAMSIPTAEFFFKHEYPLTDEFFIDLLKIPRKYLTDGKIKREVEPAMGGISPFSSPPKGENQQKLSEKKRAEQSPQKKPVGA